MTIWQKVKDVLLGIGMIILSGVMVWDPSVGFDLVANIIMISMFFLGIKALIFYQTMARHMVGGRLLLYRGIILFDLGLFSVTLSDLPKAYIVLYLLGIHAFAGVVDILRARESYQMQTPAWKNSLLFGIGNLVIAALCLIFGIAQKKADMLVYIYASGLLYAGILKIVGAFKKTAVVYIQ